MTVRTPFSRENAPLLYVSLILLFAFIGLAIFGSADRPTPVGRHSAEQVRPAPHGPGLGELPAAAGSEAVIASQLAPGDAQARNAAVPIVADALRTVGSFVFSGSAADRTRARECLALAGIAEAGAGDADQRAVMQVILNRVRHPAFAKTVCGVVFQGSERATGCQFSFTCDGSLARRYPEALWKAARERAEEALGGRVEPAVGNATHFHADYVYPWWSPELDKIAKVGPHLFFRWRGFWGEPRALSARYRGGEPDPMALRTVAQSVERPEELVRGLIETGEAIRTITAPIAPGSSAPAAGAGPGSPQPGVHFVLVSASDAPATLIEKARALCPGDRFCQVYGWTEVAAMPSQLPLSEDARSALSFSFVPARSAQPEITYFDCRIFAAEAGQCLPKQR